MLKSIKQQYIDLQEGNLSQANFMRNLRMTMPQYVTNVTSFDDSVKILKNKGILTEADITMSKDTLDKIKKVIGDITANNDEYHRDGYTMGFFEGVDPDSEESDDYDDYDADYEEPNEPFDMAEAKYNTYADVVNAISKKYSYKVYHDEIEEFMKDKNSLEAIVAGKDPIVAYEEFYNIQRESLNEAKDEKGKWTNADGKSMYAHFQEINKLNAQEVLVGIDYEMEKNPELTKLEAQKIVIKNLKKNPIYYTAEDMSGVEGYEPEYIGGKSANAEARQMQPLEKNLGNIVDKKMGMKPVKDVEKVKKDSDKGGETNKTEKGVSLMSLIAKSVRGVQKMDATGEKMKKVSVKENKVASTIFDKNANITKGVNKIAKDDDKKKSLKEKLKEMIRKELKETFDGRDNMTNVTGLDEAENQQYYTTVSIGRNIDHMKYKKVTIEDRGDTFAVYTEDATNPYVYSKSNFRYPNVRPLEIKLPEGFATISTKIADALFGV